MEVTDGKELSPAFTLAGGISFLTISKIFQRLRFSSYDEDRFSFLAEKAGISKFTARFLKSLSNVFYLEIGYMPILPNKKPL